MGRWQPDAQGRLVKAAMELYAKKGFDETTVAEIAARAGLTERTFFRYFADKREVLFGGSEDLTAVLVADVGGAPPGASPLDVVAGALGRVGALLQEHRGRTFARRRQRILTQNPELQERELIKMASWSAAVGRALRARGVDEPQASLTAEAGLAAFRVAFAQWVSPKDRHELPELIAASIEELRRVAAA